MCDGGGGEDMGSHNLYTYLYYVENKSYFKQVIMVTSGNNHNMFTTDNNHNIEISDSILIIQFCNDLIEHDDIIHNIYLYPRLNEMIKFRDRNKIK